jgi:hypothetical protein
VAFLAGVAPSVEAHRPERKTRAGFDFRTEIDGREWGLKWNQALETGDVLVAKVRVEGDVQFVRQVNERVRQIPPYRR